MERFGSTSHRGFSVRSILTFVLAVVITTLLWVIIGSHTTHAADPIANWSGDAITYNNHSYNKTTDFKDTSNTIPSGATVYQTPPQGDNANDKKVFIIYFTSGVDPPTAKTAKYVEFNSSASGLSNPKNSKDITVTPKGDEDALSACSVEGIGWIVCPLSVFMASGMDWAFGVLSNLIKVQPSVLGDPNNSMYIAWNVMRNIANLAFVIAFLIIIYSQLTSFGVSNYGLKKLIPRLIIAAILVNLSFVISAIAIDISNILGYSIQNVFNDIRTSVFNITNDNFGGVNDTAANPWAQITAIILAGGGVIGGLHYAAAGGLYLLIPLLLGLLLTLIFVVIVLAARQAIIVILVIIAPIAFVANLLPNTEKWFDKWKDLFFTMLIFFPAFSLVFGGSQLAGQLIIQNAGDNIVTVLFGMAVQIAPLVITPLLLRFSGSLLGKIAQIANNPSKGILDRNKNWAKERAEHAKQRNIAKGARWYNPASYGAGLVRGSDFRKRRLQDRTSMYRQMGDNRYHETPGYEKIHEGAHGAELVKKRIEEQHAAHLQGKANIKGSDLNIKTIELENAKVSAERANAQTSEMLSGYRAGAYDTAGNARLSELQRTMAENVIQTAAWKQGEQNNSYVQQRNISNRMRNDEGLLKIAQGYGPDELRQIGRERAQAAAVSTLTKLNADARQNTITLMETQAVEAKMSVKDYAIKEVFKRAASVDAAERAKVSNNQLEAALEIAAADGQVSVFDDARANRFIDQSIVDAVVARNVPTMKAKGGFHIQADPNLSLQRYIEDFNAGNRSETSIEEVEKAFKQDQKIARLNTLSNTTSTNLAGMKYGAFERFAKDITGPDSLLDAIPVGPDGKMSDDDEVMVEKIFQSLRQALLDAPTRATLTDRDAYARNMEEAVRAKFFPTEPALDLSEVERAKAGGGKRPASMDQAGPLPTGEFDPTAGSPGDQPDDNPANNNGPNT